MPWMLDEIKEDPWRTLQKKDKEGNSEGSRSGTRGKIPKKRKEKQDKTLKHKRKKEKTQEGKQDIGKGKCGGISWRIRVPMDK